MQVNPKLVAAAAITGGVLGLGGGIVMATALDQRNRSTQRIDLGPKQDRPFTVDTGGRSMHSEVVNITRAGTTLSGETTGDGRKVTVTDWPHGDVTRMLVSTSNGRDYAGQAAIWNADRPTTDEDRAKFGKMALIAGITTAGTGAALIGTGAMVGRMGPAAAKAGPVAMAGGIMMILAPAVLGLGIAASETLALAAHRSPKYATP